MYGTTFGRGASGLTGMGIRTPYFAYAFSVHAFNNDVE